MIATLLPLPRPCDETAQKKQRRLAMAAAIKKEVTVLGASSVQHAQRTSKQRTRSEYTHIWKDCRRKE